MKPHDTIAIIAAILIGDAPDDLTYLVEEAVARAIVIYNTAIEKYIGQ